MRTRIKVCGITNPVDAAMAAAAGADAIGVVLTESPRRIALDRAREIAGAVPEGVHLVGVFADESPEAITRTVADLPLHAVQVRGWIGIDHNLRCEVWHVLNGASLPEPSSLPMVPLHTYLLDSHDPASPGGTGRRADWGWARRSVNAGLRLIVAGGLSAENVAELVLEVHPFGVDASSGLESTPGRKDPTKVRAFIERIRDADRIRPKQS